MKQRRTSSRYGPYELGYTRVTIEKVIKYNIVKWNKFKFFIYSANYVL